jgi:hypothetical protein
VKRILGGLASLGCLIWIGVFLFGFLSAMVDDWRDSPGKKEFEAANTQITAYGHETGFGNSPLAVEMARLYSSDLLQDCHDLFKLGSTFNPSTMDNCLTYCRIDDSTVVFLCQVPDLRGFHNDVLNLLAKMAWGRAVEVVSQKLPGKKLKMAVGLRGFGSYGAVMQGASDGNPARQSLDDPSSGKLLYPYFIHGI